MLGNQHPKAPLRPALLTAVNVMNCLAVSMEASAKYQETPELRRCFA
jgi:hypothetical protein